MDMSLHCVNIYHCDLFNKQADGTKAKQDTVSWESQTENNGMKKRKIRSHQQTQRKQEMDVPC